LTTKSLTKAEIPKSPRFKWVSTGNMNHNLTNLPVLAHRNPNAVSNYVTQLAQAPR